MATDTSTKVQVASATATTSTEQSGHSSNKPLRSELLIPPIRSAPQTARPLSDDEIRTLKSLPYEQYLQTAHWRARRNTALKRAGYRCSRCSVGRQLQVHHLSYDRLGAELDADLEVLCRGCHLGEHVLQLQDQIALYARIISAALEAGAFTSIADLAEDVKRRCARARIPYSEGQVHAAMSRLGKRLEVDIPVAVPKKYADLLDAGTGEQPLTHAEACGLLAKLGAVAKPMPTVKAMTQREADARIAARQIAALILDQVQQCEAAESAVKR
jgi:hypothetical protein